MAEQKPLTDSEVENQLAKDWYAKLDDHVPVEEYQPLMTDDAEFRFPEVTVRGFEGFRDWYEGDIDKNNGVIYKFFDEVHTLKKVQVTPKGDSADVQVVVNWQASVWNPPAARSERINADAYQSWVVVRSPQTQKPVISVYVVDSLDFLPGSATL
jgi:hypothetical protein